MIATTLEEAKTQTYLTRIEAEHASNFHTSHSMRRRSTKSARHRHMAHRRQLLMDQLQLLGHNDSGLRLGSRALTDEAVPDIQKLMIRRAPLPVDARHRNPEGGCGEL